ncbi:hypothetical protein AT52_00848 [Streptococcus equi subsp. zooepidemicus Sz35]|nr:hypothetical protein AT52_00848 [Streptococcus equi subsp. zooepidemicus Sz35]
MRLAIAFIVEQFSFLNTTKKRFTYIVFLVYINNRKQIILETEVMIDV